jgi:hypothetical protein
MAAQTAESVGFQAVKQNAANNLADPLLQYLIKPPRAPSWLDD